MRLKACFLPCLLIVSATAPVRAEEAPAAPSERIVVRQCHVYVGDDPAKGVDCTAEANRECAGKPMCEVGIGDNLTSGKPQRGEAQVLIAYACGALSGEAGPHQYNNHATATLACGFTD